MKTFNNYLSAMEEVTFDEEIKTTNPVVVQIKNKQSLFSRIIISLGLAKTDKGAETVLLWCAIIGLVCAVCILFYASTISQIHVSSQAELDAANAKLERNSQ